jgi:predicted ATPase/class 3 adenylate cyclase
VPVCAQCGEDNPDRARFCLACGAALEATQAPAAEERKVVSVLFVDLVGFTAASDQSDPEDVRARLRPYHATLKQEIERFGGTVEKFIGDAVMAVFGAPVAHEDDAERAVRAALRITEAIPEMNEEHPGLDLSVRAAVNTGDAVVSLSARPERGEGIATGDVVNTASRLQAVAPIGGVAVGEITYRSTKDAIEYEPLEAVEVKGKAAPIPIWHAVRARSRFTAEIERPPTPFIGRTGELALLEQTFTRTVQESSVQLVTVTGEPGVGKSRLTSEFFTWIDELPDFVFWRHGRCLPYGEGITFWALGEIVKAHAGILESDPPDEAARKLSETVDAVIEQASEREWVKSRLAPLVGTETTTPATDRSEAFTAWRTFLESVASTRPLILLVEDLHWADEAMLEFVEHLVDWSTDIPLLVLCTARPELYERHPDWGGGKRNSTTIGLSPLSSDETAKLISALLSETVLPAETQQALLERSGGNPLYAEEFVRMLLDRGILERRGRAVELASDAEIPVPDTVQALIAARIDTLAPARKSLMHDASVVGKVFWSGAVASMSGRPEDEVRQGLHELARKELVRPSRRPSIEGQSEYSFWHILVRDVAYGQIPRAARAGKHRAAAEWIEGMAGDRVFDHAELLAHHYLDALDLAQAAGESAESQMLRERAAHFLAIAGDRAMSLDTQKAFEQYTKAIEFSSDDDPQRPTLLMNAAQAAFLTGRVEEARRLDERAVDEFQRRGDPVGAGEAMTLLHRFLWLLGDTKKAMEVALASVELLEREPPGPALAKAYVGLSGRYQMNGDFRDSMEMAEKALPQCRQFGLRAQEARALEFRGFAQFDLGISDGMDDTREHLRIALEVDDETLGPAWINYANLVWEIEGPAAALESYHKAIEFSERRGLLTHAKWARGETTWMLYDLGRWDELIEWANEVLASDPDRTQVSFLAMPYLALVRVFRGELDEATRLVDELLPKVREIRDPQILLPGLEVAAMMASRNGDVDGAIRLIEQFEEATAPRRTWRPYHLPSLLGILAHQDRMDVADRLLEGIRIRGARHECYMATCRAIAAEGKGEIEEALRLYGDAVERWTSWGHVLEGGRALSGAGRCLLQLGRSSEATERLRQAREVFVELGAEPLIADVDRSLERATALSS